MAICVAEIGSRGSSILSVFSLFHHGNSPVNTMAADDSGTDKADKAEKAIAMAAEPEKRHWFDEMDEIEWEDDHDIERLPCSVDYVITCLLLPFFNGCINGFAARLGS